MRVVTENRTHLHIRHVPWFAHGVTGLLLVFCGWKVVFGDMEPFDRALMGTVVVGFGWVLWKFIPVVDLQFDRPAGTLTIAEGRLTGVTRTTVALDDIREAVLDFDIHDTSDVRPSSRLILVTEGGEIALERGFSGADRSEMRERVNAWLAGRPKGQPAVVRA